MDVFSLLGIKLNLNEAPNLDEILGATTQEKTVEIPNGAKVEVLVTDIGLVKGSNSVKDGIVVNFLITKYVDPVSEDEVKLITRTNGKIEFPLGKKGIYANHRVTKDSIVKMGGYLIRVDNRSHKITLPSNFDSYSDEEALKFYLTLATFRYGLSQFIRRGMAFNAYCIINSRGYKDISIYDPVYKTYLPTPNPHRFIGGSEEEANKLVDEIMNEFFSKTNGSYNSANETTTINVAELLSFKK